MKPNLPVCCQSESFALLKQAARTIETPDGLLAAAVAVNLHKHPEASLASIDAQLWQLTETVRGRVRGTQPQAILAHLHDLLFDELGFAGNEDDYYAPANSFLSDVLETKRGLPITLSLVYKIVATRLGLDCHGVGLPGHFLIGLRDGDSTMLVDPFHAGRTLTVDEARDHTQERFGDEVEWSDDLLAPVSHLHWITRLVQNLLHVYNTASDFNDVAAMLEMELLLWPRQAHLQRDLGLVLARLGMSPPSRGWRNQFPSPFPARRRTDLRRASLRRRLRTAALQRASAT